MNVSLLGPARFDVIDIADWYDRQSPGLGRQFEMAVDDLVALLAVQPRVYGRVGRPPRGREVREGPVPNFPYVAVYEVRPAAVLVVSVTHAKARRRPWLRRLP